MTEFNKATASAVVGALFTAAAAFGLDLDPEFLAGLQTVLTTVLVFAVRNIFPADKA